MSICPIFSPITDNQIKKLFGVTDEKLLADITAGYLNRNVTIISGLGTALHAYNLNDVLEYQVVTVCRTHIEPEPHWQFAAKCIFECTLFEPHEVDEIALLLQCPVEFRQLVNELSTQQHSTPYSSVKLPWDLILQDMANFMKKLFDL